ncbi:hypothetical protein M3Y99_00669600 [Aphelenchoides fujianensis]|nr:hypothetical protein M3Y99_00669600 [Aphelenchoides fujianensis]
MQWPANSTLLVSVFAQVDENTNFKLTFGECTTAITSTRLGNEWAMKVGSFTQMPGLKFAFQVPPDGKLVLQSDTHAQFECFEEHVVEAVSSSESKLKIRIEAPPTVKNLHIRAYSSDTNVLWIA